MCVCVCVCVAMHTQDTLDKFATAKANYCRYVVQVWGGGGRGEVAIHTQDTLDKFATAKANYCRYVVQVCVWRGGGGHSHPGHSGQVHHRQGQLLQVRGTGVCVCVCVRVCVCVCARARGHTHTHTHTDTHFFQIDIFSSCTECLINVVRDTGNVTFLDRALASMYICL